MNIAKCIAGSVVLSLTCGCETLGVMASGAMAGAGIVMAGVGIAEGDTGTAALGGFLTEAGLGAISDDGEGGLGGAMQAGVASGLAAETGNIGILFDADSPEKLQQHLVSAVPGASAVIPTAGDHATVSGSGSRSGAVPAGASCQQREARLTQEIDAANARIGEMGICGNSRQMREVAYKIREFAIACPINDPTGEMVAWAEETIETTTRNIQNVCVD